MVSDTIRDDLASIPTRRIVRYALYALAVIVVGRVADGVAVFTVGLVFAALSLVPGIASLAEIHHATARSVVEAVRLLSYLLAAGVFLSQFER